MKTVSARPAGTHFFGLILCKKMDLQSIIHPKGIKVQSFYLIFD